MNSFVEAGLTVVSIVGGIAALSIVLSPKATTTSVIQAGSSGFGNMLATAMSPVNGNAPSINNSYPSAVNSGFGLPTVNLGSPAVS